MPHITAADIEGYEKVYRLNLINAITGYKPANLIGTADEAGQHETWRFSAPSCTWAPIRRCWAW